MNTCFFHTGLQTSLSRTNELVFLLLWSCKNTCAVIFVFEQRTYFTKQARERSFLRWFQDCPNRTTPRIKNWEWETKILYDAIVLGDCFERSEYPKHMVYECFLYKVFFLFGFHSSFLHQTSDQLGPQVSFLASEF